MDLVGGPLTTPPNSWIPVPPGSGFGLDHLPFGAGSVDGGRPHVVVAIGDHVLDLDAVRKAGHIDLPKAATRDSLDAVLPILPAVREKVARLLTEPSLQRPLAGAVRPVAEIDLRLPFGVADYVDFYSSLVHATNVGRLFRPDGDALPVAWKHLPIAYHGRSGTVAVSGTPVTRPEGQFTTGGTVDFGPTRKLDFELEVGAVIGRPAQGPVPISAALGHVAGLVLLNDWSARDIQAWEYQPLGPFAGKSFATTISPWVVPLEALTPFERPAPSQDPAPLPHLQPAGPTWSIDLTAEINGTPVTKVSFADLYWTVAQQIAHLTANGATLRTGDLLGSGTISGPGPDGHGSLLEMTRDGTRPITVGDAERSWVEDGDTVTLRGAASDGVHHIEFGRCTATVRPAPGGTP